MKRFIVAYKKDSGMRYQTIDELAEGIDITWGSNNNELVRYGLVEDKYFIKLQNKIESSSNYVMFEDTEIHTH